MATNTTIAIKQCPAGRFLFNIGSGRSVEISNQVFLGTLITLRYFLSYQVFLGIWGVSGIISVFGVSEPNEFYTLNT